MLLGAWNLQASLLSQALETEAPMSLVLRMTSVPPKFLNSREAYEHHCPYGCMPETNV